MTLDQAFAFGILGAALLLFVWGQLRYDLVALMALLAGIAAGIVPADRAFAGFGDDIVIIVGSALVVSAAGARLRERYGIGLLAISRSGRRLRERLSDIRLSRGDVVILKGDAETMQKALGELRILPLSERGVPLGRSRRGLVPVTILGATVLALAFRIVPVPVAFFAAAVLVLLAPSLTMREAHEAMEWPMLVLLGALIPLSEAVRTTGGTELLAGWLSPLLALVWPLIPAVMAPARGRV